MGLRTLLALVFITFGAALPALAQSGQPTSVNPTASAVREEQLLRELDRVNGRVSIPDAKSGLLIQPEGREYRAWHEQTIPTIGAYAILGVAALLLLFYLVRGRVRLSKGFSGVKLIRFNAFDRFIHWLTATSFIILALSGLNLVFGKTLLLPLIGPEAFTTVSQLGKYAHNYLSLPFTVGLVFMLLLWLKDNIPGWSDVKWFLAGGGMVGSYHPPAKRFNGGQKFIFWSVVLIGGAIAVSGYILMFPFYETTIAGMQLAHLVHSVGGIILVAVILGHIYIGSIGMEGAFDAMGSGKVDANWAREHHSLWAETAPRADDGRPASMPSGVAPAE
ncbi:MAG: formate dehydrogenase subunit gamma [Hyphomicrobiales bacterium]|nr:formate dehydrogenase subunit gamma [Hyphomicrobiales bacterium]